MDGWLDPLRKVLDEAPDAVTIFFRDDDAGWADDRLAALLDLFGAYKVPIDLAVIPMALTPRLAGELLERRNAGKSALGLHCHGSTHTNHEIEGRKCEFGTNRSGQQQWEDIATGQRQLSALLGDAVDPIFTPPWNRCTQDTVAALHAFGFEVLSRIRGSAPLKLGELRALDIAVDWLKQDQGKRITSVVLGEWLARAAQASHPLGVMLHHAAMDTDDFDRLDDLLTLLRSHPQARCRLMRDIAIGTVARPRSQVSAASDVVQD